MGRYSYDDMPPEGYREHREGGRRGTLIIAFVGILLTLIAIVLYLLYTPHQGEAEEAKSGATTIEVTVPEPEILESGIDEESAPVTEEIVAPVEEPEAVVPAPAVETASAEPEPVAEEVPEAVAEPDVEEVVAAEEASAVITPEPAVEETVLESDVRPMIPSEYIVADGDTLQSIAAAFAISPSTIREYNNLSDNAIAVGNVLSIPQYDGNVYTMMSGDDLNEVVSRYNPELSAADIAKLNSLASTSVSEGTRIFIPARGSEIEGMPRFSSPVADGTMLMRNAEYFRDKGETIYGVVLAAKPGTPVSASASGTVANVGFTPDRRRYVEIVHDDGYTTSYTGLERVLVPRGSSVSEGDAIGMIGTSSDYYGESAILFSVSQDGIRINPETVCKF